jgi:hypothetical protein
MHDISSLFVCLFGSFCLIPLVLACVLTTPFLVCTLLHFFICRKKIMISLFVANLKHLLTKFKLTKMWYVETKKKETNYESSDITK